MVESVWAQTVSTLLDGTFPTEGIVAIDGPSGSGKSVFADELMRQLAGRRIPAVLVRTDDFATWDDPVAWWPELESDVLHAFTRRRDMEYRPRVWVNGVPGPGELNWIRWQPLLILEGVSSARKKIARRLALGLWIDGPDRASRLERSVARDGESDRDNLRRWQEFEEGWFTVDQTRLRCLPLASG